MQRLLVGIMLLALASTALGQAEGEVESIGFSGYYRPNCWVPMRLKMRPKTGAAQNYQLQVIQPDMDGDPVHYSRPFALSGNSEGGNLEERVWVYFVPSPQGLDPGAGGVQLSDKLQVFLCTPTGQQLSQLAIPPSTLPPRNVDDATLTGSPRSVKMVLVVATSGSQPRLGAYGGARGMAEDVEFVRIAPGDLPGNVLGYHAVSGILWLNADPTQLNSDAVAALQQYINDGGRMLVCQGRNWQKFGQSPLGALLPVTVAAVEDQQGVASLRQLAELPPAGENGLDTPALRSGWPLWRNANGGLIDPWPDLAGQTAPIARAALRPGAVLNATDAADPRWPYLARWMVGLGSVAWVAQDFGDPALLSKRAQGNMGWERIWDRAFDWPNRTITQSRAEPQSPTLVNRDAALLYNTTYGTRGPTVDLSSAMLAGMEPTSTGAKLVAIVMLFFIIYWVVAAPGSYFFLRGRHKSQYSWMAFAVVALAATGVTLLVVRLVLGGAPQLRHISFVRVGPDHQAVVNSQLGIYVPRDGWQLLEMRQPAAQQVSYIIPYPVHPVHRGQTDDFLAPLSYNLPVPDRNSAQPPAISVRFRSTLKKFSAQWRGVNGGIDGQLNLDDTNRNPAGTLVNATGQNLHQVYMIYRPSMAADDDMMLYFHDQREGNAAWPAGATIDLAQVFQKQQLLAVGAKAQEGKTYLGGRGSLNGAWALTWASDFNTHYDPSYDTSHADRAALLLSIFDRLQPTKAVINLQSNPERYDLARRTLQQIDGSNAISCGQMLIFAQGSANAPLPFPLSVQGSLVPGSGTVYYQFVVPIQRGGAATLPAAEPATTMPSQPR